MSLFSRDSCVSCDGQTPTCNCASGEQCVLTSRTCSQCPTIQCIKDPSSSSGGGVNPGVIAGPVVAVLVIASLGLFWWLRKNKKRDLARLEALAVRARKAESAGFQISRSNSPQPPASARSGSRRSDQASLPAPPPSASARRSPLPQGQTNAEYYAANGADVRGSRGNDDPNGRIRDPFEDGGSDPTSHNQSTDQIPTQYIQTGKVDDPSAQSQAARTLDEARKNLFRPRQTPPRRPARSSDLHLRLSPPQEGRESPDLRSPGTIIASPIRESYLSAGSSTPSFFSGNSYDIHADAPRIVTSKQVQIGRLHQAEVVQLGQQLGQSHSRAAQGDLSPLYSAGNGRDHLPVGLRTNSPRSGPLAITPGAGGIRTLTRTGPHFHHEDAEEGLISEEPSATTPTDLRFSMGSLAYDRNSISTMGTGKYVARPDAALPTRRAAAAPTPAYGPRESVFSVKSTADSFLSTFPIIPPQTGSVSPLATLRLPQSSSVSTLDHAATLPRPLAASKPHISARPSTSGTVPPTRRSRPTTATSTTDSFLGTFPFVPPNIDDLAELPSAGFPDTAVSRGNGGRSQLGMSTTSEGLGGFDFSFGEAPPPLPERGMGKQ